jgi:hypothetical protein
VIPLLIAGVVVAVLARGKTAATSAATPAAAPASSSLGSPQMEQTYHEAMTALTYNSPPIPIQPNAPKTSTVAPAPAPVVARVAPAVYYEPTVAPVSRVAPANYSGSLTRTRFSLL